MFITVTSRLQVGRPTHFSDGLIARRGVFRVFFKVCQLLAFRFWFWYAINVDYDISISKKTDDMIREMGKRTPDENSNVGMTSADAGFMAKTLKTIIKNKAMMNDGLSVSFC